MRERLARLRWRCRRGTRELDIMLARYVERRLDGLDAAGVERFERLLDAQDPELYAWLTGAAAPHDPDLAGLVGEIRACAASPGG